MNAPAEPGLLKQHLIDPEICIRCNTCEDTCPIKAISHDSRNYVVDASICKACLACVSPCPTGAIDNWRLVPVARAYNLAEQLSWDELPAPLASHGTAGDALDLDAMRADAHQAGAGQVAGAAEQTLVFAVAASPPRLPTQTVLSANVPPWSAAHPYLNLYGPKAPVRATVVGNFKVTQGPPESDTHHLMLDFGAMPFPVLEGQSLGVLPPGVDAAGRPHHARQYSVASPRNGERPGYNNLSLTVKRVTQDHQGQAVRGVCSNYLCDAKVGDVVLVIGPFGSTFLMPNHPGSNLLMICTGTGSAPMRAMTEYRRRLQRKVSPGRLMLFFGARTQQELPYFGPLMKLPKDFIDINLAFSRTPGAPKRYVQDLLRERAADVAALLADANTSVFVCGLKSMEEGVAAALRDCASTHGLQWDDCLSRMQREGRIHFETY
ncbi:MAG: benzoyl-CoA 2,3-epoxidase subunit BoxA [Rhodoferax sp.]|nr:benzoyl-CoA 2,3-epoxidase subunit BoxA [Rhodoferax sp.]